MEWNDWIGKKVFIRTKHDKVFSGIIKETDDLFLNLIDKFNALVILAKAEIVEIKEEKEDGVV